jgi:hypothetical protein
LSDARKFLSYRSVRLPKFADIRAGHESFLSPAPVSISVLLLFNDNVFLHHSSGASQMNLFCNQLSSMESSCAAI